MNLFFQIYGQFRLCFFLFSFVTSSKNVCFYQFSSLCPFLIISTWYNFVNFFSKDMIFSLLNLFVVILILINCFFVNSSWFSLRLSRLSFLFADSFYFQVEFLLNNFYNLYNLIPFLAINNISMSVNSSISTFSSF